MGIIRKCLVISGIGAMWIVGILLMVKPSHSKRHIGKYEKVGEGIDERLIEARATLDKATAQVRSVFEYIKSRRS
jgi:hypothetical protein